MDIAILTWINKNLHNIDFFNYFFKFVTFLGEMGVVWIITAVVLFFFKKTRKGGVYILLTLLASVIINDLIIKNIIARPRPFIDNMDLAEFIKGIGYDLPASYSFPSGHAVSCFACATMITFVFKKRGAYSYILASVIAFSRVYLCVHYLSDVLVGMALGVVIASLVYFVAEKIVKKFNGTIISKK